MNLNHKVLIGLVLFFLILVGAFTYLAKHQTKAQSQASTNPNAYPENLPTSVAKSKAYTIILIGDSMTQYLGNDNDTPIRKHLKEHYGDTVFGIFNYGFGSTNVLSMQDRLDKDSDYDGAHFPAILGRAFDLIIIESFANNPLSQFPLAEGLKKQEEALDKAVISIHQKQPKAVIAFLATIAPIRDRYGEGAVVLSTEERQKWADERTAYLKNHIAYADKHHIPLINLYEKTVNNGTGNIDYINTNDFIHPSVTGVDFISKEISDWIYNNKVLPY